MRVYRRLRASEVSDSDLGWSATTAGTVYEPEPTPRWTGLYDVGGEKLYAVEERGPVGFALPGK